jgi:hypothetical protein
MSDISEREKGGDILRIDSLERLTSKYDIIEILNIYLGNRINEKSTSIFNKFRNTILKS